MLLVILKSKILLFKVEKVIKRENYKLYVKWKGYDNSCEY